MKKAFEACALLCCLVLTSGAQERERKSVEANIAANGDVMTLNVADIEAEINYSDIVFATAVIRSCEAINWSYSLNWGDEQTTSPTSDNTASHINDKGFRLRNLGTYSLGFSHEYKTANTTPGYTTVLHNVGQCAGFVYPVGAFDDKFTQVLRVWGRIPVDKVRVSPRSARRGELVTVDIQLTGDAPASGTRVFLYDPDKVLENVPSYLVVQPGASEIKPTFKIAARAPVGDRRVGAWTAKTQERHPPDDSIEVRR